MARPRGFDTEAVVSKITELFWASGFNAVSIQDIAQATGLRSGSLHAAFGNKNELFEVAFDHYAKLFKAYMVVEASGLRGAKEYLNRLIDAAMADPDRKGCLIINTTGELTAHSQDMRSAVQDRLETMRVFFRTRMEEEGIESDVATNTLFGAAIAVLTLARANQPESVLRDIVRAALSSVEQNGPE